MKKWVVFIYQGKELLRYTLRGEGENERYETIQLLAWENEIPAEEIGFMLV